MKSFDPRYLNIPTYHNNDRKPDFNNLLKIMDRSKPERPTLFEFFLNERLYNSLSAMDPEKLKTSEDYCLRSIKAYTNAGYDYTTIQGSNFSFPSDRHHDGSSKTLSLNEGSLIHDRESYNRYPWPDPDNFDYSRLEKLSAELPAGMKFIVWGPGGVLENVIMLTGYDNLCYLIADEPELVEEIFAEVGSRFVRYYEICGKYESVGAMISNDDWGFNTQTMLSLSDMRKYVFPWHRKITGAIHASGKPAILHSCGQLEDVMDEIIDDMKYDAKHSYEDNILPVEKAYERWGRRIAVFGGLDVDFLCRSTPEKIFNRASEMLEKSSKTGSYALGSGNSIPYYVPDESYLAMISAVY